MIVLYRLPGAVAVIALAGQLAGAIAAVTGFIPAIPSFTLTLPGIAGIILSIGMGVDANIITAERIKEEIRAGRSIEGALDSGNERAFAAIFDGNITVMIVAIILMGAFGPPTSVFARLLSPLFNIFGPSTAGNVYSFGYTLLVGTICNFIFGVYASRSMLKALRSMTPVRNPGCVEVRTNAAY
jgi:preprotein translocase subunit SecD